MRTFATSFILAALPIALGAQTTAPPVALTEAQQIASAVLPLPAEFRGDARVLGYRAGARGLVTLREGSGAFVCLASGSAGPRCAMRRRLGC